MAWTAAERFPKDTRDVSAKDGVERRNAEIVGRTVAMAK